MKFTVVLNVPQPGLGLNFIAFAPASKKSASFDDDARNTFASTTSPSSLMEIATAPCALIFLAFPCSSFVGGEDTRSGGLPHEESFFSRELPVGKND
ncbi:MAG TPA: hypothetical protein VKU42_11905 [Candidatus Angelobacter sp.]|nr:hypothetical protein [Candidatus Angelobacter sp.]